MIQAIDIFYLKKVKRIFGDRANGVAAYLQCIYKNGVDTKMVAIQYGEEIKTVIYENRK